MTTETTPSRWPALAIRLHPGLVAAKIGLAGGVATLLATRWVPEDVISAAFVALICSRPSLTSAVREARDQVVATALGVALATGVLLVVGPGAVAIALASTLTWLAAGRLRWGYPAIVVALFSVVYMGVLTHDSWTPIAILRASSLLLGVAAGLAVNLAMAPLLGRVNVAVFTATARDEVRGLLAALEAALAAGDAGSLAATRGRFDGAYAVLGQVRADLADLRRDARLARELLQREGPRARERAARAATALESVVHHGQDVLDAATALAVEGLDRGSLAAPQAVEAPDRAALAAARPVEDPDRALLAAAQAACGEAIAALDLAAAGRYDDALARSQAAGRQVRERDAALRPPDELAARLGPRLILLVALAEMLDRTGDAVRALRGAGHPA